MVFPSPDGPDRTEGFSPARTSVQPVKRVVLSWSGGKDAAAALAELRDAPDVEVVELLTTVNVARDRVSMHGVRRSLVARQAEALSLPVRFVELPEGVANEEYERRMGAVLDEYARRGVTHVAFADLFLEDVREYREAQLAETSVDGLWPVWGRETAAFADAFLDAGFRATVACVDGAHFDPGATGREYDRAFLRDLPDGVDPCGENGEFHTFVRDGPGFDAPVPVELGETVTRAVGDGEFHYRDLLPVDG